jgi:hypothetical protein
VEDTEKADLRAEVRGVGGDGAKGFGSRAEQDVIDFRLILIRDAGNLLREGEDYVEIFGVEEFCLAVFQPFGPGE